MITKFITADLLKRYKPGSGITYSLSYYFPKNTYYFYGYPSGSGSAFLNNVPPASEELVSARPLACAGNDVSVVVFHEAAKLSVRKLVHEDLGFSIVRDDQIVRLPTHINQSVTGNDRDMLVKEQLKKLVPKHSLIMAQPFLDSDLEDYYQISPRLTGWLNDKQNLTHYLPDRLLPKRFGTFRNGKELAAFNKPVQFPCVVKVTSSSAGDGVYICRNVSDFKTARNRLVQNTSSILIEEYIESEKNYGIQFGIPYDTQKPIHIIGVNRQITTSGGEFIGGIINPADSYNELQPVIEFLLKSALPTVRQLGWYGVGGFDVLISNGGQYVIDCNFRMTSMSAYLMLAANKQINKPLLSFSGELNGNLANIKNLITVFNRSNRLKDVKVRLLALTQNSDICRFNGVLLAKDTLAFSAAAHQLLQLGMVSESLTHIAEGTL